MIVFRQGKPVDIEVACVGKTAKGDDALLEIDTATAFILMRDDAKKDGVDFVINSALRSHAKQKALYREFQEAKKKWVEEGSDPAKRPRGVNPPGYSDHEPGDALDIESGGGKNKAYKWLVANAHKYGFHAPVKSEPWHWVKKKVATIPVA